MKLSAIIIAGVGDPTSRQTVRPDFVLRSAFRILHLKVFPENKAAAVKRWCVTASVGSRVTYGSRHNIFLRNVKSVPQERVIYRFAM